MKPTEDVCKYAAEQDIAAEEALKKGMEEKSEDGSPLIAELYVDPLPQEQSLSILRRPNTTFLIGRKGTGKSTLFQRLQYDIRQETTQTSAYIDIKTLFESAQLDPALLAKIASIETALPADEIERTLHRRA